MATTQSSQRGGGEIPPADTPNTAEGRPQGSRTAEISPSDNSSFKGAFAEIEILGSDDYRHQVTLAFESTERDLYSRNFFHGVASEKSGPYAVKNVDRKRYICLPTNKSEDYFLRDVIILCVTELKDKFGFTECLGDFSEPAYPEETSWIWGGLQRFITGDITFMDPDNSKAGKLCASLWISAARKWASDTGSATAGFVIPTHLGRDDVKKPAEAAKTILSGLGASKEYHNGVNVLFTLLRELGTARSNDIKSYIQQRKIPWDVLRHKGIPHEKIIRGKGKTKKEVSVPKNIKSPTSSIWLSNTEKSLLSKIWRNWTFNPKEFKDAYSQLDPQSTHEHFHEYVLDLKQAWNKAAEASDSVMSKLGARKLIIHSSKAVKAVSENDRKKDPYRCTAVFFSESMCLHGLKPEDLTLFTPTYALQRVCAGASRLHISLKTGQVESINASEIVHHAPDGLTAWCAEFMRLADTKSVRGLPELPVSNGMDPNNIRCSWGTTPH